jgi:uncharacterized membrane protein
MDRNRRLWWIGFSLVLVALGLFFIDIYSGHIERSKSLAILALMMGVYGLGLDIWTRTSPGFVMPSIAKPKRPVLTSVLFLGTMAVLSVSLVYLARSDPKSWQAQLYSALRLLALLVLYWSVFFAIKVTRLRAKRSVLTGSAED